MLPALFLTPSALTPQGIKAPEGPPPEDPFEASAPPPPERRPSPPAMPASKQKAGGDTAGMRFDALPKSLQVR